MRRALTLLELLVVTVLIAVLAGLLFPVCTRARERVRERHCAANLRQVGTALRIYLSDWDGRLPDPAWRDLQFTPSPPAPARPGPSQLRPYTRLGCLVAALEQYVADPGIWRCPAIPPYTGGAAWTDQLYGAYRRGGRDYPERGYSSYLSGKLAEPDPAQPGGARGRRVEEVGAGNPADELLLYCGFFSAAWDPAPWRCGESIPPASGWWPHPSRRCDLFLDGHVEVLDP